ncbi:MAG: hypothetical protein GXY48_13250 [Methanomicrobiales archaeon]|nr:hypothetical protein [Methanomicrobiales archaeon]
MVHKPVRAILIMVFTCTQCGQCCMYLGDYLVIDEQTGPYSYACSCVSTNTSFQAVVDEDKRDIFDNRDFSVLHPHACPFLRPAGDDRIVCTIHSTSPAQCKIYRCIAVRIYSGDSMVGYITGMGALHTEDPGLRALYESCLSRLPQGEQNRDGWLSRFFEDHGYRTK